MKPCFTLRDYTSKPDYDFVITTVLDTLRIERSVQISRIALPFALIVKVSEESITITRPPTRPPAP